MTKRFSWLGWESMEGKINRIETLTCRPMRFYGLSRFYDEHNIPWGRLGSLKTSSS